MRTQPDSKSVAAEQPAIFTKRPLSRLKFLALSALFLIAGTASAAPIYDTGQLNFSTSGQSMWAPGGAIQFEDSIFVGAEWNNLGTGFGGIIGNLSTTTINTNPLWWAWRACKATINFLCGSEPNPGAVNTVLDTRTGARIDLTTSGKLGLEFGYTVDSGSIDALADLSATAVLPDANLLLGEFFNLNPTSLLIDGSITTQSPKAEAYINAIAKLSGSVTAKACLILSGCAEGTLNLPTVDVEQPILVVDPNSLQILPGLPAPLPDPLAEIALLNQEVTLSGTLTPTPNPPFVLPGFKVSTALGTIVDTSPTGTPEFEVDLASIEVQAPDISTSGGLDGNLIKSSGRDDFLLARLDIDGVATMAGAFPPLGIGLTLIDIPGFKVGAQFDALDVDAGPDLGITQDFELDPTLMVRLDFSAPLMIDGMFGPQMFWEGAWDVLPNFALLEKTTTFAPTFWLDAALTNTLGIDLGLSGTMDFFKFGAGVTVAGIDLLSIGPISLNSLLGLSNELFSTPKLRIPIYDIPFTLGGFGEIQAAAFTITVPEPGTLLLLLTGLGYVVVFQRRKSFVPRMLS